MKKFTLYWNNFSNLLLLKDVGLIPFIMKKYYGYDSSIITWNIEDELTNSSLYLEDFPVEKLESVEDLHERLKEIDVLMLIGTYNDNLALIDTYKSLKPDGKVFLKLDMNSFWINTLINSGNLNYVVNQYRKCHLVSVESRRLHYLLSNIWGVYLQYSPNGYYEFSDYKPLELDKRNNSIVFAGKIGNRQKSTHILLEGFKNFADKNDDWILELAGGVEPDFQQYLDTYFTIYPHLKDRVKLLGYLNVIELEKKLSESKVFCLTSSWEGCANVYAQALSKGCYVITTDVDCAVDMINYGKYGSLIPISNIDKLTETFFEVCNDEFLKDKIPYIIANARKEFSWINVCKEIDMFLQ